MNISLIGLPGCGKTTVGRRLAENTKREFLDTDELIERREQRKISEIFAVEGEEYFRDIESEIIDLCCSKQNVVISTGGGAVLRKKNREALALSSDIVFLDRPYANISNDIQTNGRPLLTDADALHRLAEERTPLYRECADIIFLLGYNYCLIGHPIAHSISPEIHETITRAFGKKHPYALVDVLPEHLKTFIEMAVSADIKGFNVTIPHKKTVTEFCCDLSEDARASGAVNTVSVINGKLYGNNTDIDGLTFSLKSHGFSYNNNRILLIGDGGAAVAIKYAAERDGGEVDIVSRKNRKIANEHLSLDRYDYDILINATQLGMSGYASNFSDYSFLDNLSNDILICDLVYNPLKTELLKQSEKRRLKTLNGLEMLVYQAMFAENIWEVTT